MGVCVHFLHPSKYGIRPGKKDSVRQLADMEPFIKHLLHQLADMNTEDPEQISSIAEMKDLLE